MKLERITIAATSLDEMANFYNAVFDAGLQPVPEMPMYFGMLAGVELLLCSNEIAQVDAKQNRKQLRLRVDSLNPLLDAVKANGGSIVNDGADENARIV